MEFVNECKTACRPSDISRHEPEDDTISEKIEIHNNILAQINSEKTKEHSCKYRKDTGRQINQICAFVCIKEKNDF